MHLLLVLSINKYQSAFFVCWWLRGKCRGVGGAAHFAVRGRLIERERAALSLAISFHQ